MASPSAGARTMPAPTHRSPASAQALALAREEPSGVITTPAGSTIEPIQEGAYRICDANHHCRRAASLWEAQQLVQWAEVHHSPLDGPAPAP